MKHVSIPVVCLTLLTMIACRKGPEAIEFGLDHCAHCRMQIADPKYGAEIVTEKGRVLKFDAIECMAVHYRQMHADGNGIHSSWTIDYSKPGSWVRADSAYFLHSPKLPSPMGMFLTSFGNRESIMEAHHRHDGEVMSWADVLSLIERERPGQGM